MQSVMKVLDDILEANFKHRLIYCCRRYTIDCKADKDYILNCQIIFLNYVCGSYSKRLPY